METLTAVTKPVFHNCSSSPPVWQSAKAAGSSSVAPCVHASFSYSPTVGNYHSSSQQYNPVLPPKCERSPVQKPKISIHLILYVTEYQTDIYISIFTCKLMMIIIIIFIIMFLTIFDIDGKMNFYDTVQ